MPASAASLAPVAGHWSTASASDDPDTTPADLSALGEHAEQCRGAQGRWFRAHCAAESVLGFLAPRLVTTAVVVAIVFGIGSVLA